MLFLPEKSGFFDWNCTFFHLSGQYVGGGGWKQTLDPIVQKDEKYPRKETFTVYSPDTTDAESNDNMDIFWEINVETFF